MPREGRHIAENVNTPPGSPIHVGERWLDKVKITYTKYDKDDFERKELENIDEFIKDQDISKVKWLDISGLHDTSLVDGLCSHLKIHPLAVEDILNTSQGAKLENYGDYLFINSKSVFFNEEDELDTEQISFLLFKDRLISFQERESDLFKPLIKKLEEGIYLRKNGSDDLLYGLLDIIVDNYFLILERIGNDIDIVEDELLADPTEKILQKIYLVKRKLIFIKNPLWAMRNIISSLSKNEYELIDEKTVYYLRDIYDHIIQMIDLIETYREISNGMLDTYLSSIGNKTNDVMKILTIFSTIFTPLTFIAGVYGMNFRYLPELDWKYSYLTFWIISIIITAIMLRFFRKKGWL